jgi:hypothetical protein
MSERIVPEVQDRSEHEADQLWTSGATRRRVLKVSDTSIGKVGILNG